MKLICIIKTIYRTLTSSWFWEGVEISGHDYIEQDNGELKCEICGRISK